MAHPGRSTLPAVPRRRIGNADAGWMEDLRDTLLSPRSLLPLDEYVMRDGGRVCGDASQTLDVDFVNTTWVIPGDALDVSDPNTS